MKRITAYEDVVTWVRYVCRNNNIKSSHYLNSTFPIDANDLSVSSTKTKYIKLNTKTKKKFNNIRLLYKYTLKEKTFFFSFCFLVAPVKVYKKVVKFSFKQQKIFCVLVFSFMYLVLFDAMDRSYDMKKQHHEHSFT